MTYLLTLQLTSSRLLSIVLPWIPAQSSVYDRNIYKCNSQEKFLAIFWPTGDRIPLTCNQLCSLRY